MPSLSPVDRRPHTTRGASSPSGRSWWFHLHFWIGWVLAIPLLVICVTGIGLAFEEEFYRWEQPEHFALTPGGARLSLPEVLERYEAARPRLHLNHLEVAESPDRAHLAFATEFDEEGNRLRGLRAFLNPYTGEITREGENPTFIRKLEVWHRTLTFGQTGRWIIGTSSLLLAITSVGGLVLWWPSRGGTLSRTIRRRRALDWHNTIGLVALLPLIVLAITGITFTWGKHAFPLLDRLQGEPSRVEVPEIPTTEADPDATVEGVSLADAARRIENDFAGYTIRGVQGSRNPSRPYAFNLHALGGFHPGGTLRLFIDPRTGEEFARGDVRTSGPVGWYRRYFYILHTGHMFHWAVRFLWALASLAGVVLIVSGTWISLRRWRRTNRTAGISCKKVLHSSDA